MNVLIYDGYVVLIDVPRMVVINIEFAGFV